MSNLPAVDNPILRYWQDAALREKLGAFSVDLQDAVPLKAAELKNGTIQQKALAGLTITKTVWIAPFKITKKSLPSQSWVPLWIPANLIEGQLQPDKDCPLPWLLTQFFDLQSESGTLFENIEHYDKVLLDYFFDAQLKLVTFSWETYFSSCMALFQGLLRPHVQDILETEYIISDHGWMIDVPDVFPLSLLSPLAHRYASLEEPCFQEYKESYDRNDLLLIKGHYPKAPVLLHSQNRALIQMLSLKEGEIQALKIPPGTEKIGFLQALIASIWCQAASVQSTFSPGIVCVGPQKPEFNFLPCDFSQTSEYQCVNEGMQILTDYLELNDKLKKIFGSVDAVDNILLARQIEDQKLEAEFERCTDLYAKWQKQYVGIWASLVACLPNAKKRKNKLAEQFFRELITDHTQTDSQSDAAQLIIEKIRKIKVTRTKIHNELVDICQWVASKNGVQHHWLTWAQKNLKNNSDINLEDVLILLRQQCGESLFKLACDYFKTTPLLNSMSIDEALEYPFDGLIDYLIVDNAHRLTASKVVPLLNKAKIAIFLGDDKGLPVRAVVSPLYDDMLLKAYQVANTEEDLEDLAYRGIQSSGSAFCVAKAVSAFKKIQIDGVMAFCELSLQEQTRIHPAIFEYSRVMYARSVQVLREDSDDNVWLPLCYVHIQGEKQSFELSYKNVMEAEVLLDWLVKNRVRLANKSTAIVTLFLGQKQYLMERLMQLNLQISVYLLNETDNLSQDIILFSPVYTRYDVKPYLLDQGETFLHVALTRARESFMIFADMDIFNAHTHTPCGHLAKLLFQKEVSYV